MLDLSWKRWQEMLSFNRAGGSSGIIITVLLRWLIRTPPWAYFSHIIVSVDAVKGPSHHKLKKNTRSNIIGQRLFIRDYHARLCIDSCSVTYLPSTDIFQTLSEVSRAKLRSTSKGDKWISAKNEIMSSFSLLLNIWWVATLPLTYRFWTAGHLTALSFCH